MSSPGFFDSPEDYAAIQALQRRQAYARALMEQGGGDPGNAAYGGLRAAGNSILGAFLSKRADDKETALQHDIQGRNTKAMEDFYGAVSGQGAAPSGGMGAALAGKPSPQVSNNPGSGPTMDNANLDPEGNPSPQPVPLAPNGPSPPPMPIQNATGPTPMPQPLQAPQGPMNPMQALIATHNPGLMAQLGPKLFENQMNRDNKVWENSLPLSTADTQRSQLELDRAEALAKFNNGLPLTEKDKASLAIQRGQLGVQQGQLSESRRHNLADENLKAHPFGMGVTDATGDAFLKSLPPGVSGQVKAIAEYRQPAPASRSAQSMAIMNAVAQYKPDYDATQFGAKNKARLDFTTGKNGNTVRSLNVAVQHLDQLGQLSDAMGNGNLQMANKIGNLYASQTGSSAPTNFNAAKQLVGDEIVKAIVGAGGGVADREEAAHNISAASSPQQLAGVIKTYQGLLSGQLVGLRQQYQKSTGLNDFEEFLAPETRAKLENHGAASGGVRPAGGGGGVHRRYDKDGNLVRE